MFVVMFGSRSCIISLICLKYFTGINLGKVMIYLRVCGWVRDACVFVECKCVGKWYSRVCVFEKCVCVIVVTVCVCWVCVLRIFCFII